MSIIELILIAIGLSMDAFAVSICKGLSMEKMNWKNAIICGIYFGGFQFIMPVIGYYLGYGFRDAIADVDHWVAFVLLFWIGISMIKDARSEIQRNSQFNFKTMLPLAVATSIDALVAGVSFAVMKLNVVLASVLVGVITFTFSAIGVKVGNVFGSRYKAKAQILGGVILIAMGAKVLVTHLFLS